MEARAMDRPSIDHSILSPSGRCSKRAREAALKREYGRLFPPGFWDVVADTPEEATAKRIALLLGSAKRLRDLAAMGMSTKKYTREADRLETAAANLLKPEAK